MRPLVCLLLVVLGGSVDALAQAQDPVGPFVIDLRGLTIGLPTAAGWTPPVPAGGLVPSRGFGLEGGGHVYAGRLGPARLGVGATLGLSRGTASPEAPDSTAPGVVTRTATLAPQLSLNFGHRLGWSYLSAGYGGARITSRTDAPAAGAPAVAETSSGWVGAVNIGGGARWFLTEHLGVGFDLRWHRLSAPTPTGTAAPPRATLFQLAVGVSIQ